MRNTFTIAGALSGAIAVLLGAFAAHGLRSSLSPENLQVFHTGVEYQFYHSLALLFTGVIIERIQSKLISLAGYAFLTGIILFSGSLYLLSTVDSLHWIGIVTPLGGLCFISGWIFLAIGLLSERTPSEKSK